MAALTHFPKTRLSELVRRFGGLTKDDAVEAATKNIESLRSESEDSIEASIAALEAVAGAPEQGKSYSPAQMQDILHSCDVIVTLAGTFGYTALDTAARSLCDVTDGFIRLGRNDVPSILVHVRAMRMVAPRSAPLPQAHIDVVLSELAKVIAHHGFGRLSDAADKVDLGPSAAAAR